ncbi:MAG: hypothetical protein JXJ22_00675 [Bacteroidales bacterium]|nr:hypothetical protein [Bacteroidales bacterium]
MISDIYNFYEYHSLLASGGQPTNDQLIELKNGGYEAIINISPVSTKNYLANEAELTESLQMQYVHFPIDCSNLQEFYYSTFKGILNGLHGKRIFIHCGGNIKSSNLIHMYQVLELGKDEEESLDTLKKIQDPEEKWDKYFRKMGMMGLHCCNEIQML